MKKIESVLPTIDKIYKEYAEKNHFPGFTYGVVVDGKLIHTGTAGYTDLSKKTPATTQSLFRIASMSKSFTTMAILQLRDAGKLDLDDRADKYIPEMKNTKLLTADAPAITIRHLLTHAAGFPEDNPWGDRQLADTNEELLKLIKSPIAFSNTPGVAYEYSNLGITLLGYIIQKVSGKTYQQFINENIFQPLGMAHTKWEYAEVPADKLAHGYRWRDGQWTEEALLLPSFGSAVFQTTFFSLLHSVGGFFSAEKPLPLGPRKAGQSAAVAMPKNAKVSASRARNERRMACLRRRWDASAAGDRTSSSARRRYRIMTAREPRISHVGLNVCGRWTSRISGP